MSVPDFSSRLSQLIHTPSISSNDVKWDMSNQAVIALLANWLADLHFDIKIQPISDNKSNLIARFGSGSGGLILSGHTDTVPYDQTLWDQDPFQLTEKNNRLYGLGSCDMKGFFSFTIEAFLQFQPKQFTKPLYIVATCDEESTMSGARALDQQLPDSVDAVIIGEPTLLQPIRKHKGIMFNQIVITGKSGHSSNPSLGNNAIEAMYDVIGVLLSLQTSLQRQYHHIDFAVQYPTLNLGCIHGGDNVNRICGQCELHFDLRSLPAMSTQKVMAELDEALEKISQLKQVKITRKLLTEEVPAFEQAEHTKLVMLAETLTAQQSSAVAFATEAPFFHNKGLNTIILGPGSIDQAHQPNEFLALDQIKPGVKILTQFIQHYCTS